MIDDFAQWEQYRHGINVKQFFKIVCTEPSLITVFGLAALVFFGGAAVAVLTFENWILFTANVAVVSVFSAGIIGILYGFLISRRNVALALLDFARRF